MKSHAAVEQFFHPRFLPYLGVTLALARGAFAWALAQELFVLHAAMPDVLERLRVQAIPFLEAWATVWSFSWWEVIIACMALLLGAGAGTRIAAGVLLLFFLGASVMDRELVFASMGTWSLVSVLLLSTAIFSQWGRVWGIDEIIARLAFVKKRGKRGGLLF